MTRTYFTCNFSVIDTRGVNVKSPCQMYNVSFLTVDTSTPQLQQDLLRSNENWNFTDHSVVGNYKIVFLKS